MGKKILALITAAFITTSALPAFAQIQNNTNGVYFSDDFDDVNASSEYWTFSAEGGSSIEDVLGFADGKLNFAGINAGYKRRVTRRDIFPNNDYTLEFDLDVDYNENQADAELVFDLDHSSTSPTNFHHIVFKNLDYGKWKKGVNIGQRINKYGEADYLTHTNALSHDGSYHLCITYDRTAGLMSIYNVVDGVRTKIVENTVGNTGGKNIDINASYCNWTIDNFVIKEGLPSAPTVSEINASSVIENGVGTVRFAYQVNGYDVESAGACVVPLWLFERDGNMNTSGKVVTIDTPVGDGKAFGADIAEIPESQFNTVICSKPFITVGEDTTWGDSVMQASVNSAINTNR